MKKIIPVSLSFSAALLVAACGGGGSDSPTQSVTQANASGKVTMTIPLKSVADTRTPAAVDGSTGTKKPTFIDGDSNGRLKVFFDGVEVFSFQTTGTPAENQLGPSGTATMENGGTFTYSTTIAMVRNQPVAIVTGEYKTTPGNHTLGAVQVNGVCTSNFCIDGNEGYVLSEGQADIRLQPGTNPAATLYMRGVMQSVYICNDNCNGHEGPIKTDGLYHLYVVVADENGTAIPYQETAPGKPVPFSNGAYQLVEKAADGQKYLTIMDENTGEDIEGTWYTNPGQFRKDDVGNDGSYGIGVKLRCDKVGVTKLVAQLNEDGGTPAVSVDGFAYSSTNYPSANMELGPVGANRSFGNQLTVNCEANGSLTVK